jgi:hypothetical protein
MAIFQTYINAPRADANYESFLFHTELDFGNVGFTSGDAV